jgi:RNA chaperone Hfq
MNSVEQERQRQQDYHRRQTLKLSSQRSKAPKLNKKERIRILDTHERLLQKYKDEGTLVEIINTNGIPITGTVVDFDRFAIILRCLERERCIFKHAILDFGPAE